MNLLTWLIFGALVGWLADFLRSSNKKKSKGCLYNIFIGVVGSFIGGTAVYFLRTGSFNIVAANSFDFVSIIVSVVGAVILLAILD